jgi:hypothetical protein
MAEKRDIKRIRKRLSLRFGPDGPTRLAFTEDLSAHGMFIKTVNLCPLGSRVKIELTLPDGNIAQIEGTVRWSKKVPPQMMHLVSKSGFGVKILKFSAGEENYNHLIAELHSRT